jgi:hypothetical protein
MGRRKDQLLGSLVECSAKPNKVATAVNLRAAQRSCLRQLNSTTPRDAPGEGTPHQTAKYTAREKLIKHGQRLPPYALRVAAKGMRERRISGQTPDPRAWQATAQ